MSWELMSYGELMSGGTNVLDSSGGSGGPGGRPRSRGPTGPQTSSLVILESIFFLSEKQKHCNIPNFVHCGQNCFIFCADVEVFLAKRPSGCWFCCAHLPPMYSAPALKLPTVQKSIVTIKALKLCYSRASESDMVQDHKHHLFDLSIGLTKVGE